MSPDAPIDASTAGFDGNLQYMSSGTAPPCALPRRGADPRTQIESDALVERVAVLALVILVNVQPVPLRPRTVGIRPAAI